MPSDQVCYLNRQQLQSKEEELSSSSAYFFPQEGQIDARELLNSLQQQLFKLQAEFKYQQTVVKVKAYQVETAKGQFDFDYVCDCRGVGAMQDLTGLRAVRGELIYVHAPSVNFSHVIRLFHPRYRLYVIPRPQQHYLLGATEIESADNSAISVRSCLELLSSAYALHKGFAEARIVEMVTGLRAAFADNLPQISHQPGLLSINGLYRHGFLIAPALIQQALSYLA